MKSKNMLRYLIFPLILFSCEHPEQPTLDSRWRLMKVEELDFPISSPSRFYHYPDKPYVKDKPVFSHDADYQVWSWNDSLRIEYSLLYNGVELFDYSAHPFTLLGDTVHFPDALYHFQILDNSLILNGYGVSTFGKRSFTYYFELED